MKIKVFTVRKDWELIQADWIYDIYTTVQLYSISKEDKAKHCILLDDQEAKDLCGEFWPYTIDTEDVDFIDNKNPLWKSQ